MRLAYAYHLFEAILRFRATLGLLVFSFWSHGETGFKAASERNKDALHARTDRKLTLDAAHTIRVAGFLACASASPNRPLETKRREEERRKRKEKEKEGRGETGESGKRHLQTASHYGLSVARSKGALIYG